MESAVCSPKHIENNVVILIAWVRQSGNFASCVQAILIPDDVKGIMVSGEAVS